MRFKSWPYYSDWTIIFGKDRATGESAEALFDAVNDLTKQDKPASDASMGGENIPFVTGSPNDNESENMSSMHGEAYMSTLNGEGTSTSTQRRGKKKMNKRPRSDDLEARMVDMMADMAKIFAETKTSLGELAQRIGFDHDASSTRRKVLDALTPLFLSVEDKIKVAKVVCGSANELDIFFGLDENERAVMVQMILEGRY
ncbi:PREDICTED: uncharacterized protein LOC105960374 isoform X2 [Erythranthe guttata]|nr:PREDICTED: uncharacterized protein LOC105960374 isoform X1 [Erythranthe guttata]XP_012839986.1 PREDICTED: uncharacterized protein LOC105960374 isoform X2 [Erythranthe guttata]|eukprot:XP_012839985.1 PREDICTED: uncharacterized protein LOC105960374 isoform X1 [Erythranthe guttata]